MKAKNSLPQQTRLSVSTWSLHNWLGAPPFYGPGEPIHQSSERKLLELPAKIAAFGITTLEICHFHLPTRDEIFLDELREELKSSGIELWSLLIDAGDLNAVHHSESEREWMESWLPVAANLGAANARAIAGKGEPNAANLAQSIAGLKRLADVGKEYGVGLTTENWFALTSTPAAVRHLIEAMEGRLGLCLDFGNWGGPDRDDKYERLAQIADLATSCHTKGYFRDGEIVRDDYLQCLNLVRDVGFAGPHTLIYDSGGDEWMGLAAERDVVSSFLD